MPERSAPSKKVDAGGIAILLRASLLPATSKGINNAVIGEGGAGVGAAAEIHNLLGPQGVQLRHGPLVLDVLGESHHTIVVLWKWKKEEEEEE